MAVVQVVEAGSEGDEVAAGAGVARHRLATRLQPYKSTWGLKWNDEGVREQMCRDVDTRFGYTHSPDNSFSYTGRTGTECLTYSMTGSAACSCGVVVRRC